MCDLYSCWAHNFISLIEYTETRKTCANTRSFEHLVLNLSFFLYITINLQDKKN